LRHSCLPQPGDEHQLKRLCARIMSQALDRGKPLWETWIIEGLEGGRMAMINKVHHCMIDGISGVDLLSVLMSPTAERAVVEDLPSWTPRPVPSPAVLLRDALVERVTMPVNVLTRVLRDPGAVLTDIRDGVSAIAEQTASSARRTSATPFNQPIGPPPSIGRRWTCPRCRRAPSLGGSFNDVARHRVPARCADSWAASTPLSISPSAPSCR
jgi:hypothetical protein